MISSELSSMQEILTNSIYQYEYDISNEFLSWIKYKRYPIVSWIAENRTNGKLSQNFRTSYGKWWIPTRLYFRPFQTVSNKGISIWISWRSYVLSSQEPSFDTFDDEEHWTMVDIRQAGKYVSKLFIFIHFM